MIANIERMFEELFAREWPPGPELMGMLAGLDLGELNPLQRSDCLTFVAELSSWLTGFQCRLLHGLERDFSRRYGGGNAADEVMAAQRISAWGAERHVRLAYETQRAPAVLTALESGRLGVPHAHRLIKVLESLDDRDAARVAEQVCANERLEYMSVGEVARAAARAAAEVDPQATARRRTREKAKADVSMEPAPDGMAWLTAYGPAEDVAAAMTSVSQQALAARRAGNEAPLGVLRFQALTQLVTAAPLPSVGLGAFTQAGDSVAPDSEAWKAPGTGSSGAPDAGSWPAPDSRPGPAPHSGSGPAPDSESSGARQVIVTHVTVPWVTLAGVQDAPGELAGYGPIPAPVARQLAAQSGVWWRLLTDPATGQLCPTPATGYHIPEQVRRFVVARDQTCSHPGCDRPARGCDLDHAVAHPKGPTCPCNLTPRCRRHHNAKTHHGWKVAARLDGHHSTTSPTGRIYSTAPEPPPGAMRDPGPIRDPRPWWWPDTWPPSPDDAGIDLVDSVIDAATEPSPAEWAAIGKRLAAVS